MTTKTHKRKNRGGRPRLSASALAARGSRRAKARAKEGDKPVRKPRTKPEPKDRTPAGAAARQSARARPLRASEAAPRLWSKCPDCEIVDDRCPWHLSLMSITSRGTTSLHWPVGTSHPVVRRVQEAGLVICLAQGPHAARHKRGKSAVRKNATGIRESDRARAKVQRKDAQRTNSCYTEITITRLSRNSPRKLA
jgi:hypothetical protein